MTTEELAEEGIVAGPVVVSQSGWDLLYHSERLKRSAWSNQPHVGETAKLRELCRKSKPQVIVELGSRYGGTTLAMHDAAPDAELFAFDRITTQGDTIIDFDAVNRLYGGGYEDEQYHTRRSWFPANVEFIHLDFHFEFERLKSIVDQHRAGTMFLFVDGDWGRKHHDMLHYLDWLRPGDVIALNNSYDVLHADQSANEWDLAEVEAILLPKGFEHFEFEWCRKVGLVLSRAWKKLAVGSKQLAGEEG